MFKEDPHKINEKITAHEIRLVGDNVEVGVYTLNKALNIAQDLELDLVEISPKATPPVCKILEYKKFLYEQKKREKALKAKSTKSSKCSIDFSILEKSINSKISEQTPINNKVKSSMENFEETAKKER